MLKFFGRDFYSSPSTANKEDGLAKDNNAVIVGLLFTNLIEQSLPAQTYQVSSS